MNQVKISLDLGMSDVETCIVRVSNIIMCNNLFLGEQEGRGVCALAGCAGGLPAGPQHLCSDCHLPRFGCLCHWDHIG